jgi:predicted nuclease with RNAse H fold
LSLERRTVQEHKTCSPSVKNVLGIDLGGASSRTTGCVILAGREQPEILFAGQPERSRTPVDAEQRLRDLVEDCQPTCVAIDAPLTLPPCMTCSGSCRGPGPECESRDARELWSSGWNATSQRLCEKILFEAVGARPLPTMQLGVITARAVTLCRSLLQLPATSLPTVLEVYPRATLRQLAIIDSQMSPRLLGEPPESFRARVLLAFEPLIARLDEHAAALADPHVFDALISAVTGWLGNDGLEAPPAGFDVQGGWIWYPKPSSSWPRASPRQAGSSQP